MKKNALLNVQTKNNNITYFNQPHAEKFRFSGVIILFLNWMDVGFL